MFGHIPLTQSAGEHIIIFFLEDRTCIFYWYFKVSADTEGIKQDCRLLWHKFELLWEKSFFFNEHWNKIRLCSDNSILSILIYNENLYIFLQQQCNHIVN